MDRRSVRCHGEAGFSLMEAIVAVALLTAVAGGAARLFAMAMSANADAKRDTSGTVLAIQKMEQLRGLAWSGDADTSTDLSVDPPGGSGRGLSPSPANTLEADVPGYVDFLDRNGAWAGTGSSPPAGTHYVRRWAIVPLPAAPDDTLVLTVMVTTLDRELRRRQAPGVTRGRLPGDAWLVTVRTRRGE